MLKLGLGAVVFLLLMIFPQGIPVLILLWVLNIFFR